MPGPTGHAKCHSPTMARKSDKSMKGIQGNFNMKECRNKFGGQGNLCSLDKNVESIYLNQVSRVERGYE